MISKSGSMQHNNYWIVILHSALILQEHAQNLKMTNKTTNICNILNTLTADKSLSKYPLFNLSARIPPFYVLPSSFTLE